MTDIPAAVEETLGRPVPSTPETRGTLQGANDRVASVRIRGGLAAGPRFIEVQNLQIAWEPEGDQVYDNEFFEAVADAWELATDVVVYSDLEPDEISTVSQLRDLLGVARDGIGSSWERVYGRPAQEIAAWWTSIKPAYDASGQPSLTYWLLNDGRWALDEIVALLDPLEVDRPRGFAAVLATNLNVHDIQGQTRLTAFIAAYLAQELEPSDARSSSRTYERLLEKVDELDKFINEPYAFDIYSPADNETAQYNLGVITTYRQVWLRLDYQAGDLVGTIPLGPGERRSYSKKTVRSETRRTKERRLNLNVTSDEDAELVRTDERVRNAISLGTSFENSGAGFVADIIGGQSTFGVDQGNESQDVKNRLRELTRKAARKVRSERTVEVESTSQDSLEMSQSQEIQNPNDELSVTYLFYELEERFVVTESFNRIEPVILIPFSVPAPNELDEDWIIRHAWILRRTLLDDQLIQAVDYLTDRHQSMVTETEVYSATLAQRRRAFERLGSQLEGLTRARVLARDNLAATVGTPEGQDGLIGEVLEFVFGGSADDEDVLKARRESQQKMLDWIDSDIARAQGEMRRAGDQLESATEAYRKASGELTRGLGLIQQLRAHLKQNILYYMQQIWREEPSDQRYLRIYKMPVVTGGWLASNAVWYSVYPDSAPLHEVADLDSLLGFKGNYAIFPIQKTLVPTIAEFVLADYLDDEGNLNDPDGNFSATLDSAMNRALLEWGAAPDGDAQTEGTREWLTANILTALRSAEEGKEYRIVTVPSQQLMIEVLPGEVALMEDFKLRHRQLDVEKAAHEADQMRLENLRRAARLTAGAPLLGDPQIEKVVYVDSNLEGFTPPA
ncbi:hypothetical protein ACQE98_09645 [Ornithinimicrobium sp. W1679]|uniref:hypothetical protein n=1 Tax=Ornithinimicrobium sp. W1679 TaxID=3418770 RepID=UPI003CF7FE4D